MFIQLFILFLFISLPHQVKDLQGATPLLAIYARQNNTTTASDPTLSRFTHALVQLWSR